MTTMKILSKQETNLSQTDSIDQIHIHPSYNNDSHGFDIALLRLTITILYIINHIYQYISHIWWIISLHCSPFLFIRHQSQINNQWLSREMIELNSSMQSSVQVESDARFGTRYIIFLTARSYSPSVISAISGEIWPVCLPTKEVESYEGTKATVIFSLWSKSSFLWTVLT